jgi:hypothetical protein
LPLRDPVANCFPLEFGINCFASQILSGASVPWSRLVYRKGTRAHE